MKHTAGSDSTTLYKCSDPSNVGSCSIHNKGGGRRRKRGRGSSRRSRRGRGSRMHRSRRHRGSRRGGRRSHSRCRRR